MIIALTDFEDRPYRIPNQEESTDLLGFMAYEEQRIAVEYLLGYDLWKEFDEAVNASGPLDEKWDRLLNGYDYTYNDKLHRYPGWVETIRPALYSLWVPRGTWKFTNIGYIENSAPQQSALMDDPNAWIVEAWNEFVKKAGNYYNCHTFYGFMKSANADPENETYPTWQYNPPQFQNRFGL